MNESVGVLLFLTVLAVGLIAVIVAIVKSGDDDDGARRSEEKKEPVLRSSVFKEKEEPRPSQMTICSYRAMERTTLCPCCDGENPVTATSCRICGQPLKKEGV